MRQSFAHTPDAQMPPLQAVPSLTLDQVVAESAGEQTWQLSAGLIVPAPYVMPPMTHAGTNT